VFIVKDMREKTPKRRRETKQIKRRGTLVLFCKVGGACEIDMRRFAPRCVLVATVLCLSPRDLCLFLFSSVLLLTSVALGAGSFRLLLL
jgi:hypothetical protein